MSTPNYTKDYNPLRITDLWKYERPMDINREVSAKGKKVTNKKRTVTVYDSIDDTYITCLSLSEFCRNTGCGAKTIFSLLSGVQNSAMGGRYYRTKEEYIELNSKPTIDIFDSETKQKLSFNSKQDASQKLKLNWHAIHRLVIGQIQLLAGRYTLVK